MDALQCLPVSSQIILFTKRWILLTQIIDATNRQWFSYWVGGWLPFQTLLSTWFNTFQISSAWPRLTESILNHIFASSNKMKINLFQQVSGRFVSNSKCYLVCLRRQSTRLPPRAEKLISKFATSPPRDLINPQLLKKRVFFKSYIKLWNVNP